MASQQKQVYFNIDTEKDLLDFANSINFSTWVKDLIRKNIHNNKVEKVLEPVIEKKMERKPLRWNL